MIEIGYFDKENSWEDKMFCQNPLGLRGALGDSR